MVSILDIGFIITAHSVTVIKRVSKVLISMDTSKGVVERESLSLGIPKKKKIITLFYFHLYIDIKKKKAWTLCRLRQTNKM